MGNAAAGEVMVGRAEFDKMVKGAGEVSWPIQRVTAVSREGQVVSVVLLQATDMGAMEAVPGM